MKLEELKTIFLLILVFAITAFLIVVLVLFGAVYLWEDSPYKYNISLPETIFWTLMLIYIGFCIIITSAFLFGTIMDDDKILIDFKFNIKTKKDDIESTVVTLNDF